MTRVTSLVLRRMRAPLLVLICAYAVAILGYVLIPGRDASGAPWRMTFLDAFYFVSYMATTIGFGEIPHAFNGAQRLWTSATIYLTVISWFYAIGAVFTLLQNPAFRRAVAEGAFARSVRRIVEPFYIVCGYGDTGSLLVEALVGRQMRAVVIDKDPERINDLALENLSTYVPGLCADAGEADHLLAAGLRHRRCRGVVALTNDDAVNLKIAISCKLLRPRLTVICRAESRDTEENMASFGTDHIINPFESFADRLALALHSPSTHLIYEWLTGIPGKALAGFLEPRHGTWILCGYGRFGKAVERHLAGEGVKTVIVEADPASTRPPQGAVIGRGTEAVTLREAGVESAVGIVAGTDDDTNNLSIIVTARDLNPNLYTVARQNRRSNEALFAAAGVDQIMERSDIIAHQILALITAPLLSEFLRRVRGRDHAWVCQLVSRLVAVLGESVPDIWVVQLDARRAPAPSAVLAAGLPVRLGDLYRDPRERARHLDCLPLMLRRRGEPEPRLLPDEDLALAPGDRVLFCGREGQRQRMAATLNNDNLLRYLQTGVDRPDGWLWRRLSRAPADGRPV